DQCSKPNEFFSCGSACDNECSTLNEQNRTNCPIINVRCNERCYCDDGYARDDSGMCVPVSECPKCGFNEVYRTVAICPPMPTCDNTYEDYNCPDIDPMPTESKCICKVGYLRNSKGVCVPEEQCENRPKCGVNEVYRTVAICPPLPTCNNNYENHNCPAITPMPTTLKCICRLGYLRNSKGVCVPRAQCDN
ncbi:hypothetical protein ACJJTC_009071, partial [Scirpophaga incertulas]